MIVKKLLCGEHVLLYSIGQAAAKMRRHAGTLRRLELHKKVPASFTRSDKGFRLYTSHELELMRRVFDKHGFKQGVQFTDDCRDELATLFTQLHTAYKNNDAKLIPDLAISNAQRLANKADSDA